MLRKNKFTRFLYQNHRVYLFLLGHSGKVFQVKGYRGEKVIFSLAFFLFEL
jgi:hypothetical protein